MQQQIGRRFKEKPEKEQRPSRLGEAFSYLLILLIAFGAAWLVRAYVAQPFKIPSGSMIPAIEIGDHVLAEKLSYRFGDIERGDIITFLYKDPASGREDYLIKRVIGVEGDTIDFVDGRLVLNGVTQIEPYVEGKPSEPFSNTRSDIQITYPYTVPEGHLWMMGDNRTNSQDSRYYGPIDKETVTARGFFTFWPLDRLGGLE